jgi:hypothetical protein
MSRGFSVMTKLSKQQCLGRQKKHVFGSARKVAGMDCQTLACALDITVLCKTLHITARQYGEVVLPDASTGQSPGTLAAKLSRCKEGMAWFLPSWHKFCCMLARSRYKFGRSREFIHGNKFCGVH